MSPRKSFAPRIYSSSVRHKAKSGAIGSWLFVLVGARPGSRCVGGAILRAEESTTTLHQRTPNTATATSNKRCRLPGSLSPADNQHRSSSPSSSGSYLTSQFFCILLSIVQIAFCLGWHYEAIAGIVFGTLRRQPRHQHMPYWYHGVLFNVSLLSILERWERSHYWWNISPLPFLLVSHKIECGSF